MDKSKAIEVTAEDSIKMCQPWSQKESHLEWLLQIVLPGRGYVMAIAEAYFDESGTDNVSPFLCVAGYIFEKANAVALDVEWRAMLTKYRLPYFRMSECAHNARNFAHLTKQQCDRAAREAIELTKVYASKGIAISLEKSVFELLPPEDLWDNPYAFVCCQVLWGVKKWADETGFQGDVAYFFEAGADGWKNANSTLNKISAAPMLRRDFRWSSHTAIGKDRATPLQCADLLAWHWLTHNKRLLRGEKNKRADFANLLGRRIDPHHYDREAILFWLAELEAKKISTPAV